MEGPAEGASGGLAIIWNPKNYQVEPLRINKNWIGVKVSDWSISLTFNLINLYGPTKNYDKKVVWKDISFHLQKIKLFSYIGGDFNAFTSLDEKLGKSSRLLQVAIDFNKWI